MAELLFSAPLISWLAFIGMSTAAPVLISVTSHYYEQFSLWLSMIAFNVNTK